MQTTLQEPGSSLIGQFRDVVRRWTGWALASKVGYFNKIAMAALAQVAQTVNFMFPNVAYIPTVYKTWVRA